MIHITQASNELFSVLEHHVGRAAAANVAIDLLRAERFEVLEKVRMRVTS